MSGQTTPETVPQPNGSNLPQVLYTARNRMDAQFTELQRTMGSMFLEVGEILTFPDNINQIIITIEDRFANVRVPLHHFDTRPDLFSDPRSAGHRCSPDLW